MSDEELNKLATEMKNIKPSGPSRQRGMDAAMAAFGAEFASAEIAPVEEKILAPTQGLAVEPRPTSQNTPTRRVQTFGRDTMTNIRKIFDIKPQALMMGGSCMAALIASFVYFQAGQTGTGIMPPSTIESAVETVTETPSNIVVRERRVMKTPARTEERTIPAITKTLTRRVVKRPASTAERVIPEVTKQVSRRVKADNGTVKTITETVVVQPARTELVTVPAQYATVSEPVAVQEASTELVTIPPVYETVRETIEIGADGSTRVLKSETVPILSAPKKSNGITSFSSLLSKTRSGPSRLVHQLPAFAPPALTASLPSPREPEVMPHNMNRNQFENYESNPITSAAETPVSTFSIDVDTASYSFLRATLNRGQLPPSGTIRVEEMINYFPYDYAAPTTPDEPFKANVSVTPTPWNPDTKLMHIGIKGYVPPVDERPSSNIVFLIDTSGSMNRPDKLPLLISSFKLLLNTLDADDTVSIVTYAGSAGTVLEPTPASDKHKIKAALERLRAGGSTAGAAGLELAYQKAAESFDDDAVNRVILATDGDFNVGFSSPDEMKSFIKKKRETGIFLSVLGFGNGNYNDKLMQSLAQNGNGVAAYIDTLSEANKVLADEAGSALITIAKDVKIQVEFNPETISEYRLIGYETRALKRQDFNNDKVDAGDIGAGHSVTAIYELTPVGSPTKAFDPLRYVEDKLKRKTTGSDEYAFVKIRHKLPKADTSTLQTFPVGPAQDHSLKRATDDMRFAAAVAAVGQKLRGDSYLADFSYDEAIKLASGAKGDDDNGYRAEFIQLVRLAKNLQP